MRHASRRLLVAILAACAAMTGPAAVTAPAHATPIDHVRVRVVAGPAGASHVTIRLGGSVAQTGTGTLVSGAAVGLDIGGYRGGAVTATTILGSGARAATSSSRGGVSVSVPGPVGLVYPFDAQASLDAPALGAGDVMEMIVFFPNGEVTFTAPRISIDSGSYTALVTAASGARTLVVAGDGDGGDAIAIGGIARGTTAHAASPASGIAGAIVTDCSSCRGTWRTPGSGFDREWSHPGAPPGPPSRMFAGPAGAWRWTWTGEQAQPLLSEPVYGAWVPVGDDWPMFVSGSGS